MRKKHDQGRSANAAKPRRPGKSRREAGKSPDAPPSSEHFLRSALDGLSSHIAIVNQQGVIEAVNKAWRDFAANNGPVTGNVSEGANYLAVCAGAAGDDAGLARQFALGVEEVLSGHRDSFEMEYPCHSPDKQRWFVGRVTRFPAEGASRVVIAHEDITARRQAEDRLRQHHALLDGIINGAEAAVFSVDTEYRYTSFNQRHRAGMKALYGTDIEIGQSLFKCMTVPEDREKAKPNIDRALRGETFTVESFSGEEDLARPFFEIAHSPIRADDGAVIGMAIVARDITQRKQAEEALRESEERYRRLIEVCPDAIFVNCRGKLALINQAGLKLFGATKPEQMLGRSPFDFTHPDYHALVRERLKRQLALGESVPMVEQKIFRLDGTLRTVEVAAAPVMYDGELSVQAVLRDVTERKQAEDALRESEEKYRLLLQNADMGFSYYGPDGKLLLCNQVAAGRLGGAPADFVGKLVHALWGPELGSRILSRIQAAGRSDASQVYEDRVLLPGGDRWLLSNYSRVCNVRGEVAGVQVISNDITERKNAEQAAQVHEAALAQMSRVVTAGELASGLAHELNQPLGAILLYAETCQDLLKAGTHATSKLLTPLDSLISQVERVRSILANLKNFLRKQPLERSTVDMNRLLYGTLSVLAHELDQAGVTVRYELAAPNPRVIANAVMVEQVIVNLVMNAVQAMSSTSGHTRCLTLGTAVGIDGACTVRVRDNGPGVSTSVSSRLFEAFVTSKPQGLGLGLSLSKSIIEQHGGRIWHEPAEDGGAVFSFVLPEKLSGGQRESGTTDGLPRR